MTQYKVYTLVVTEDKYGNLVSDSEIERWVGTSQVAARAEGERWAKRGYETDVMKVTRGREELLKTYYPSGSPY